MRDALAALTEGLRFEAGASPTALASVQAELGVTFPDDYVEFLLTSNGADGTVGDGYLMLYRLEDVQKLTETWWEGDDAGRARFVLFGSDGGGEAYVFDKTSAPTRIVMVPFASADPEDEVDCGTSFSAFLRKVRSGP